MDDAKYYLVDTLHNHVMKVTEYKNRKRMRTKAEKLNQQYGSARYWTNVLFPDDFEKFEKKYGCRLSHFVKK